MSDLETRYHETWLGMVQPVEGLVVSIPVLVDAQCMKRQPPSTQQTLLELCPETETKGKDGTAPRRVADLPRFLAELLELTPDLFDAGDALPEPLSLYVPEGRQTIRPTMALRKLSPEEDPPTDTPAAKTGAPVECCLAQQGRRKKSRRPSSHFRLCLRPAASLDFPIVFCLAAGK